MGQYTAVVLGSTGLVGSQLVLSLLSDPNFDRVIGLTRRPVDIPEEISGKYENWVVDFENLDEWLQSHPVEGVAFFSCLGTTKKQAGSIDAQRVVDLDFQWKFAQWAFKGNIQHYGLVSSAGANSDSSNEYLKMKGELEDLIQELSFTSKTIVRPSLLMGHREGSRLGEMLGSLILPWLCRFPILSKYKPIEGREVGHRLLEDALINLTEGTQKRKPLYELSEVFTVK